MLNTILGSGAIVFGLIFLFHPAKHPTARFGYKSLLAKTTASGFYLAQRWCRNTLLLLGLLQLSLGIMIYYLDLTHLSFAGLVLFILLVGLGFLRLEYKLRHYLMRIGQLPADYHFRK